jgi:hypothetical protein
MHMPTVTLPDTCECRFAQNEFDSTKSQTHITHVKSLVIGFASVRSASQRSP